MPETKFSPTQFVLPIQTCTANGKNVWAFSKDTTQEHARAVPVGDLVGGHYRIGVQQLAS